jgi:hypothetical protein
VALVDTSSTKKSDGDHRDESPWAAYVIEQLAREDARKDSLEKRGLAVVTTAGALATLLFAFAAFDQKNDAVLLSGSAVDALKRALIAYLVSAGLAIATNAPFFYAEVKPDAVKKAIKTKWADPTAEYEATATRVKVFTRARKVNNLKAVALLLAIAAQAVGVFFIAQAVWKIL